MPVTTQIIGTGLTKRPRFIVSGSLGEEIGTGITIHVHSPMSEEEVAASKAMMENMAKTSTFEGLVAPWEAWCQSILTQAKLPPWDKDVRIDANGNWADDLPEDWYQRPHEILKSGEGVGRASDIVEQRGGIDSPEWFAAEILGALDLARHAIACESTATTAHLVWNLVILIAIAHFKFRWELAAMTGEALQKGRPTGTKNSAQSRSEAQQERRNIVRKVYDELCQEAPALTHEDVIRHLRKEQKSDKILNVLLNKVGDASLRKDLQKPEEWSTLKSHKKKSDH